MDCSKCKFYGPIAAGSGHHRTCTVVSEKQGLFMVLNGGKIVATNKETGEESDAVKQNPHGVKNGWCTWPVNFDPIWIDDCIFFAEPEKALEEKTIFEVDDEVTYISHEGATPEHGIVSTVETEEDGTQKVWVRYTSGSTGALTPTNKLKLRNGPR